MSGGSARLEVGPAARAGRLRARGGLGLRSLSAAARRRPSREGGEGALPLAGDGAPAEGEA